MVLQRDTDYLECNNTILIDVGITPINTMNALLEYSSHMITLNLATSKAYDLVCASLLHCQL